MKKIQIVPYISIAKMAKVLKVGTIFWEKSYNQCFHEPFLEQCPPGKVFNPNTKNCDWPFNYECPNGVELTLRIFDTSICIHPNGIYPNDEDKNCNSFIQCFDGVPSKFDCGADLVFDPNVKHCVWPYQYTCKGASGSSGPTTTTTSRPRPKTSTPPTSNILWNT